MHSTRIVVAVCLGLGLVCGVLWLLDATIPLSAAAPEAMPELRPLSNGISVHYVAVTGTDSGDCTTPAGACRTVQYAVDQAAQDDEIRVATGIYTDVNDYGESAQVVYISKTIALRGGYSMSNWSTSDPDTNPTTLDAEGNGRVVFVTGQISPTVEGFRITGGDATGLGGGPWPIPDPDHGLGGGVYVITATATISNNQIVDNLAPFGAGICLDKSDATVFGNTVAANTAEDGGGGLLLANSAGTIYDNRVRGNDGGSNGGGLYLYESSAKLIGNLVVTNTALTGGGFYLTDSDAMLSNNTVITNSALGTQSWHGGGGLFLNRGTDTLDDNVISGNTAPQASGGGIHLLYSEATLKENTVRGNQALAEEGGGLYLAASPATLNANAVFSNSAETGGGVFLNDSDAVLTSNTVTSNTADGGGGIFLLASAPSLNANILISNTADFGGAMIMQVSTGTLTNNVIADNRAEVGGSGLAIQGSSPRLLHNTIARNHGGDGDGVRISSGTSRSIAAFTNTILVSQTVGITITSGNTVTLEATLWGDGAWANAADWGGGGSITTGTVNLWGDPAFLDPDAGDYHISIASAAVNSGVNAGVGQDIDRQLRPQGAGYEIGADETGLMLTKSDEPDPVRAGAQLTYTIRVTNTSIVDLHAIVTDWLPLHIMTGQTPGGTVILPGGVLTWTPTVTAPGGVWVATFVVTVELGYAGPLTNVVQITSAEGVTDVVTTVTTVPPNQAPDPPYDPAPADGAVGVPLTPTLSWQSGDPDGDPVAYSIAFGDVNPPPVVIAGVTVTNYDPGPLAAHTAYFWAVTATDGISETPGGVWQFTTWNHAPDVPTLIAPPDGAIKVPLTQTLRWSSEDADGDLITYSVAFGTADPPPIAATTTLTQYAPALQPLTTYYWAVTATDGISDSRGPVWRLSTDSEYALYLPLAVSNK